MKTFRLFLFVSFAFYSAIISQPKELFNKLKSFNEIVEIKEVGKDSSVSESYEVYILQPLDHNNPAGPKFKQRIFISHKDENLPVVFVTEGYSARGNRPYELTRLLNANQIVVEHRYFGNSVPENKDWQFLNIKQSADDYHRIVKLFKQIYVGKWISTGISKGGQTTLFYKRFYPNDVDVAVPYVAPVNVAQEDPRIYIFLNSVGTEECRNKMTQFQRAFLSRRDEIMPMLMREAETNNTRFFLDWDELYEFWVFEYSFAFWQWGSATCEEIPLPDEPAEFLFEHMKKANSYDYFMENTVNQFGPFYVQAYNEIGFYGYDLSPFKDLLIAVKDGSSKILVPKDAEINFDCSVMHDINTWLQKHGNNILYIYGGNDTWSATAIQLTGETNAVKMVKKKGNHGTRIYHFEGEEKEKIYSTLEDWLNLKIQR